MIKFGREYIYRPETGNPDAPVFFDREEVINTEVQILNSDDLIEKVVAKIGVAKLYPKYVANPPRNMTPFKMATLKFKKDLTVSHLKKSDVVDIYLEHKDPEVAARAVNALVAFFTERHLQLYSTPKSSFLESQLALYRQRLDKAESELEIFKQQHGVYSLSEQRTLLLQQQADLDSQHKAAECRVRELQEKIAALNIQRETISENVVLFSDTSSSKPVDDANSKLLALQLQEEELLAKYDESNRLVANVRREIQVVQDFINEQGEDLRESVRVARNETYQDLEKEIVVSMAELSSSQARKISIQEQLGQLEGKIKEIDAKETVLYNLRREQSTNESNYKSFLGKLEEARVTDEMDRQKMANIKVIQKAMVPAKPAKPNKKTNIAISLVLGAVLGIAYALLSEFVIDQGLATPSAVEKRLHTPVLATISYKDSLNNI